MIDRTLITKAILAADATPEAREIGADLVDQYLDRLDTFSDTVYATIAVECGWFLWLDEHTLVVGVCDRVATDGEGPLFCEWKTRRAPKVKKDGGNYKGDDEDGWLEEISSGVQLAVYAVAMRKARFTGIPICPDGTPQFPGAMEFTIDHNGRATTCLNVAAPRIMVRAIIKSSPAQFWPETFEKGVFTFPGAYLDTVEAALLSKAEQIRGARRVRGGPAQLPGLWCTNRYFRTCEFLETVCGKGAYPIGPAKAVFDPGDPANAALEAAFVGHDVNDPELVVLSASSYAAAGECMEKYVLNSGGWFPKVSSIEQEVGTVTHAGLAAIYGQLIGKKEAGR